MSDPQVSPAPKANGCLIAILIVIALVLVWVFTPVGSALTRAVQPPVQVSLSPFLIFKGYYVTISNTSSSARLTNIVITYTGSSGNSTTQQVRSLGPGESVTADPSDVNWRIERHEKVSISADGYVPKTLETDVLIDR